MKQNILSLRLNRRVIGAAVLADDILTMVDERQRAVTRGFQPSRSVVALWRQEPATPP